MSRRRRESPPSRPTSAAPRPAGAIRALPIVVVALAVYLATQYLFALRGPFVADDYVFIDRVEHAGFFSLWGPSTIIAHYYRPWSRELHYWTLLRTFGANPFPFHVVSMLLALATGVLYFHFVRRIAGAMTAAAATASVFALSAWGMLLFWAAGSQDLWMFVFALATLLAARAERRWMATACFTLALLSKETAATVPGIVFADAILLQRRSWREALNRVAPLGAVLAVWAAAHPMLGGRLWQPMPTAAPVAVIPASRVIPGTLLSLFDLDEWPRPAFGWRFAAGVAVIGAALLVAVVVAGWIERRTARAAQPNARASTGRLVAFGVSWAVLAWLPLLMPALGWRAYYALLGALGAWLAIGALIARWPALAIAVVCALSTLRAARAMTPSADMGSEWFQRRAANFVDQTREYLMASHPTLPHHARIYLASVPGGVGLVPGGETSPAVRLWYGDPTIGTFYLSRYRRREPSEPAGTDYFFRYDAADGWREIGPGAAEVETRRRDATWMSEQQDLMSILLAAGDWAPASRVGRRLTAAAPHQPEFAFNLAVCYGHLGQADSAAVWFRRAAALPGATAAMRAAAARSTND